MKKLAILFTIMALLLVSAVASADPLPDGAGEQEHWELSNSGWVHKSAGDTSALARAWTSGPRSGSCNRAEWVIDFTNHASVAQWASWSIAATRWDWRILKPGTYAADCISFTLTSNNSVYIDYEGFDDLARVDDTYEDTEIDFGLGVLPSIATWYSFGPDIAGAEANGWVAASALNNDDDLIPDSRELHAGMSVKLFTKITVANCNSSGEYEDTATVTLVLQNQQPWVDAEGGWVVPQA